MERLIRKSNSHKSMSMPLPFFIPPPPPNTQESFYFLSIYYDISFLKLLCTISGYYKGLILTAICLNYKFLSILKNEAMQ